MLEWASKWKYQSEHMWHRLIHTQSEAQHVRAEFVSDGGQFYWSARREKEADFFWCRLYDTIKELLCNACFCTTTVQTSRRQVEQHRHLCLQRIKHWWGVRGWSAAYWQRKAVSFYLSQQRRYLGFQEAGWPSHFYVSPALRSMSRKTYRLCCQPSRSDCTSECCSGAAIPSNNHESHLPQLRRKSGRFIILTRILPTWQDQQLQDRADEQSACHARNSVLPSLLLAEWAQHMTNRCIRLHASQNLAVSRCYEGTLCHFFLQQCPHCVEEFRQNISEDFIWLLTTQSTMRWKDALMITSTWLPLLQPGPFMTIRSGTISGYNVQNRYLNQRLCSDLLIPCPFHGN